MTRSCSRNRPRIDITRMFSDTPWIPGRRQQIPRTHRVIFTPALEARYSARITSSSTSAFSLAKMAAGLPARARAAWASILASTALHRSKGATASLR
jgi:hypothetical protein